MELKYNISQLGMINAYLFGNAEKCYEFLENKKYIKKLEEMNQLGVIQNTTIKTSHKRMEYVVLQLFILNLLKGRPLNFDSKSRKEKYNLGLSNTNKIGKFTVSGMDLISIWILLFNSGHLMGTFASEKGLLKSIKNNSALYEIFENNMPNELKPLFKRSIDNNEVYHLHKLLIIFSLNIHYKQARKQKNKEFIKFLINCCQEYVLNRDKRKIKLILIFNKIRQISYLFLDSQYSAFPINFSITPILLNLDEYINEILSNSSYFNKTLNSLDSLLAHNIYYSKESIEEFNLHSYNYYKKFVNKNFTENELKNMIISAENTKFTKETKNDSLHIFLDFNGFLEIFYEEKINTDLELQLNKLLPENCLLSIENNLRFDFIVINIIFISGNTLNHLITISKFTKELVKIKNEFIEYHIPPSRETETHDTIKEMVYYEVNRGFSNAFKEILLFILNNIIKNYYFKFVDKYDNIEIISPINKNHIEETFKNMFNRKMNSSVKYEKLFLESLSKKLIYPSSTMLISLSSIKGYTKTKDDLKVEIDGLIFQYKENKLHLYFIEAKNQSKHADNDAEKALEEKFNKLNLKYSFKEYKKLDNFKGKYCHLII